MDVNNNQQSTVREKLRYFNSIKVRLKHVLLINLCGLPIFQFQVNY